MMKIEIYHDGIAFYTNDMEYEIASYSNKTDSIVYNERNLVIPYDDNRIIVDEVRRYKRALEAGI